MNRPRMSVLFLALCISLIAVSPVVGQEEKARQAVPLTEQEKADWREQAAAWKQQLAGDHSYLDAMWKKFDALKAKYDRSKSDKARSSLALRIVRQTGRVETDRLQVWFAEAMLAAADKGLASSRDIQDNAAIRAGYRAERARSLETLKRVLTKMDPEITEVRSRLSYEDLKKTYGKEIKDADAR
jgi:hypothetical protein